MRGTILYYTCNVHDEAIEQACRSQLSRARPSDMPMVSISREPIRFGDWNYVVEGERGPLTMHKQILAGLKRISSGYLFLCESDVMYHPSHFAFSPTDLDTVYYNTNVWKVRWPNGHAMWTDDLQQVSGCCASGSLLRYFYTRRVDEIERKGFDRHYEAGPKTGHALVENWQSEFANLDIRHDKTLTKSKWSPAEFRNQRYAQGWAETDIVAGWGQTKGRLAELLKHGVSRWEE